MRALTLCAVLVLSIIPGFSLAQKEPKDREMCLMILPWLAHLRTDLVGPLNFKDAVGAGLAVVAHTRRKEALNCVFMYEKPAPTYIHVLYHFESEQLMAVRLAPANAGTINMKAPAPN